MAHYPRNIVVGGSRTLELGLGMPARDGHIFRNSYRGTDVVPTLQGMDIDSAAEFSKGNATKYSV